MKQSVFYHAGCPVCVDAEQKILDLIGRDNVEVVDFGQAAGRLKEAEDLGVKSVPALVVDGSVLHINFGASLDDVKKSVA